MNGLDVQILSIQTVLLGTGAMSVYAGELRIDFMLFLTCSIFAFAFFVAIKGMQWLSNNRSPAS